MTHRRQSFSLIELVAVITIAVIVMGLGALAVRAQVSDARRADQLAHDLLLFCARVRAQAMSTGTERVIHLNSAERRLESVPPSKEEEGDVRVAELKWNIPENIDMELPQDAENPSSLEIFRFFPDGGGSGTSRLTFKLGPIERTIAISRLTGLPRVENTEEKKQ